VTIFSSTTSVEVGSNSSIVMSPISSALPGEEDSVPQAGRRKMRSSKKERFMAAYWVEYLNHR
jgi:hypothetical protein